MYKKLVLLWLLYLTTALMLSLIIDHAHFLLPVIWYVSIVLLILSLSFLLYDFVKKKKTEYRGSFLVWFLFGVKVFSFRNIPQSFYQPDPVALCHHFVFPADQSIPGLSALF